MGMDKASSLLVTEKDGKDPKKGSSKDLLAVTKESVKRAVTSKKVLDAFTKGASTETEKTSKSRLKSSSSDMKIG